MEKQSMFTARKTQYCQDPKLSYEFNATPFDIPACYFVGIDKLIESFFLWREMIQIDEKLLKEKNKTGRLTLSDFKIYYNATVTKRV